MQKILYSKCPHCKQHGLPALKTSYKYNPVIECKCCHKKYHVSYLLTSLVFVTSIILFSCLGCHVLHLPIWVPLIVTLIVDFLFQYYAPLEEADEKDS